MDLSTVKTELKTWERQFKSKNGREPTKADIKANPDIGKGAIDEIDGIHILAD